MNSFYSPENIKLLQNLLNPEKENNSSDSEPDDRLPSAGVKFLPPKESKALEDEAATSIPSTSNRRFCDTVKNQPKTLDDWEEQESLLSNAELDQRPTPEYRIIYKQSLAPEEIYLQLGRKTPATSSCEEMCVEISMPKEVVDIDRMQLDVKADEIDLQTPIYHLKLPLMQPIIPDRGKALWDKERKILRLTLRMKREYDFMNF